MIIKQVIPPKPAATYHLELTETEILALRALAGFSDAISVEIIRQHTRYAEDIKKSDGDAQRVKALLQELWEQTKAFRIEWDRKGVE